MRKVTLGASGIVVSELCFGTLPLGPLQANIPPEQSIRLIQKAIDAGINFIDTAEMYRTQPYIGAAIKDRKEEIVISTKSTAATYGEMQKSIEKALKELGLPAIHIFLMHAAREKADVFTKREGAFQCLLDYKQQGLIKAVGIATHTVETVAAAADVKEIDIIFPIINRTGLGIIGGTPQDMIAAIRKAAAAQKGIYAMKIFGGGHLLDDIKGAYQFIRTVPGLQAYVVGMINETELVMNIKLFNDEEIPQHMLARAKKDKKLVTLSFCTGCGQCVKTCPNDALSIKDGKAVCNQANCLLCGYCNPVCPQFALRIV